VGIIGDSSGTSSNGDFLFVRQRTILAQSLRTHSVLCFECEHDI
jgi:hypothetical protein